MALRRLSILSKGPLSGSTSFQLHTHISSPQTVFDKMVSAKVQLAQSATNKFEFDVNVAEFVPPVDVALNPNAKEFKYSGNVVQNSPPVQTINFDSYSSDDESPRDVARHVGDQGINREAKKFVSRFNHEAKEFVPRKMKPAKTAVASVRPPPGLESGLGLSVHAKEFVPPTPAPVRYCAVNLDDYTDDESEEEAINFNEWRGLCGRLASPYIWSDDKEGFMDEPVLSDSEAETAEPSSPDSLPNSDTEGCSGCESP